MIKQFLILAFLLTSSGISSEPVPLPEKPVEQTLKRTGGNKKLSNPGSSPKKKRKESSKQPNEQYYGGCGCLSGRMHEAYIRSLRAHK